MRLLYFPVMSSVFSESVSRQPGPGAGQKRRFIWQYILTSTAALIRSAVIPAAIICTSPPTQRMCRRLPPQTATSCLSTRRTLYRTMRALQHCLQGKQPNPSGRVSVRKGQPSFTIWYRPADIVSTRNGLRHIFSDISELSLPILTEDRKFPDIPGLHLRILKDRKRDKTRCASFISLSRRSPHTNTSHSAAAHCSRKPERGPRRVRSLSVCCAPPARQGRFHFFRSMI